MKEITLKVKGLKCHGCEDSLKKDLLRVNGIESVLPSYINGNVKIIYDEAKVSVDLIEKTIKENGREVIK